MDLMKSKLVRGTLILVNVCFFVGIPICAAVPFLVHLAGEYSDVFKRYEIIMDFVFVISGVFAVFIFYELRRMFRTIKEGNPFVTANVDSLKRMGWYSLVIMAAQLVRLPLDITAAVLVVIIVFVIAGLFSFVLSQVFRQAVIYKQENDLTI